MLNRRQILIGASSALVVSAIPVAASVPSGLDVDWIDGLQGSYSTDGDIMPSFRLASAIDKVYRPRRQELRDLYKHHSIGQDVYNAMVNHIQEDMRLGLCKSAHKFRMFVVDGHPNQYITTIKVVIDNVETSIKIDDTLDYPCPFYTVESYVVDDGPWYPEPAGLERGKINVLYKS